MGTLAGAYETEECAFCYCYDTANTKESNPLRPIAHQPLPKWIGGEVIQISNCSRTRLKAVLPLQLKARLVRDGVQGAHRGTLRQSYEQF
jgi:hypothetical protein